MGDVKIDADNFCTHLKALYKSWEEVRSLYVCLKLLEIASNGPTVAIKSL